MNGILGLAPRTWLSKVGDLALPKVGDLALPKVGDLGLPSSPNTPDTGPDMGG